MKLRPITAITLGICLVACVTVNVYFPESAAERAADVFIKDVYGQDAQGSGNPAAPVSGSPQSSVHAVADHLLASLLWLGDCLLPQAAAQQIDINIATPAISALQKAMEQRHRDLKAHYDSGAVGMAATGLITLRDPKLVPLQQRNEIKKLVVDENADRNRLYSEIAKANAHPEWEQDIRKIFAERWVGNAPSGWWYQSGDSWLQKK
jgi:uncharacterized protein YdbL (DUF1318 family)